jgi:metal-responsive CopG/Arc/MetJ family transcriptional regulator
MAKGRMVYLDEDKKIGHYRASEELISELAELAKELGMSRSGLTRRALESFVQYMNDARAIKKITMFDKKPTVETWLNERNNIREMTTEVQQYFEQINIAKTPDEKIQLVAAQNNTIARMINLLHKTTMT